jgi:hypothetical protein
VFCYRVLWFIVIVAAFGLFGYMLWRNVTKLMSYPSSVDIKDEYVTPLTFPTVTICNENQYRQDV